MRPPRKNGIEKELSEKNQALMRDLERIGKRTTELNEGIVFEHEEGFYKSLRQASFLLGVVDPNVVGFDIEKDVIDGELVQLEASLAEGDHPGNEEPHAEEEEPVNDDGAGDQ